ncbi:hypothetical protein GDO86_012297 [Hymenochirus boettgeri]|uniref:Immunoglobulin V-set domain-containing protein n=1 Tax=Hymenochirus boettgeri TaxID=247094 RepID=A0A8T2IQ39_9PIPI|nr:hypothetical protein GDO86_012297 [Hymenochirus boettgeri]
MISCYKAPSAMICHFTALLCLAIVATSDTSAIKIHPIPECVQNNQNVTLNVLGIDGAIRLFTWYKGTEPNSDNQILNYLPSANPPFTKGAQYFTDVIAQPNGSLVITNLKKSYEGNYTVQIQTASINQAIWDLKLEETCGSFFSAGVIAGIVIAVLTAIGAIVFLSFYLHKKFNNREMNI